MRPKRRPAVWTQEFFRAVNPQVRAVGFHKAEPGWISPVKNCVQTDFDLWFVAAGAGEVRIDERWHRFAAGDLLAIKPGSAYQRERTDNANPFQVYFAHLLPFGREDGGRNDALAEAWPLRISLVHRPEFLGLFNQLFEAHATRLSDSSLAVKGLAFQLIHIIFEELQKAPSPEPPRAYANLLRAKQVIETEYARNLSLRDIAAHCGLSPSHLSALFARRLGAPPIEYLIGVRLREAKLLLAKGERVKETARAVGFHSQHYFSRLFRKKTGLSPTQFMMRHARR